MKEGKTQISENGVFVLTSSTLNSYICIYTRVRQLLQLTLVTVIKTVVSTVNDVIEPDDDTEDRRRLD